MEAVMFLKNNGIYFKSTRITTHKTNIDNNMVPYQPGNRQRNEEYKIKNVHTENDSCNKTILFS
jgi:hypothetical protein